MGAPFQQQIEYAIAAGLACGDSEAILDEVAALADVAAKWPRHREHWELSPAVMPGA